MSDSVLRKRKSRDAHARIERKNELNQKRYRTERNELSSTRTAAQSTVYAHLDSAVVREEALRNTFQIRAKPESSTAFAASVSAEMEKLQQDIAKDLHANITSISPDNFSVCTCCGHQIHLDTTIYPTSSCKRHG